MVLYFSENSYRNRDAFVKTNHLWFAATAVVIAGVSAWMGWFYASRGSAHIVALGSKEERHRLASVQYAESSRVHRPPTVTPSPVIDVTEDDVVEVVEEDTVQRSKYEDEVSAIAAELAAALASEDENALREIVRSLAVYRKQTLLNAIRGLVRHGLPEQRRNALYALALSFGSGTSKMRTSVTKNSETTQPDDADLGIVSDGLPESPDELERQARQTHDIVCAVGDGLEDNDTSVRQAAFEAMMSLDDEERGILSQQVLSGEDVELKRRLLSELSGSEDKQDLMLSISALENEDPSVRSLAAANVEAATGQDFKTQDEALEWLESQTDAAIAAAEAEAKASGEGVSASGLDKKE